MHFSNFSCDPHPPIQCTFCLLCLGFAHLPVKTHSLLFFQVIYGQKSQRICTPEELYYFYPFMKTSVRTFILTIIRNKITHSHRYNEASAHWKWYCFLALVSLLSLSSLSFWWEIRSPFLSRQPLLILDYSLLAASMQV